jgi:hypothetical protein
VDSVIYIVLERDWKMWQGKQDRISNDNQMVMFVHEVASYSKICLRYDDNDDDDNVNARKKI